MKTLIEKVNSSYDLALAFFIIASSFHFVVYLFTESKTQYILLSVLFYVFSLIFRKKFIKYRDKEGFTEFGFIFLSFILTAYLLYVFNLDPNIHTYLPSTYIHQYRAFFVLIFIMSVLSAFDYKVGKFITFILLIIFLFIYVKNAYYFNNLILESELVSNLITGFPIIYIITNLFGLQYLFISKDSSQQPTR